MMFPKTWYSAFAGRLRRSIEGVQRVIDRFRFIATDPPINAEERQLVPSTIELDPS
jgi:hypothetical protein